ncbi:error-prone DNA polymerase [Aquamicrobium terrae]
MTIEDETTGANVVIREKVFEQFRRVVLSAGMIGIKGRIQPEGEVVHVVARDLFDLLA